MNILSLLNPARNLKVEDAMKVARELVHNQTGGYAKHLDTYAAEVNRQSIRVLQSFESLLELKLEKGYFDESEKEKVMFEGFEKGRNQKLADDTIVEYFVNGIVSIRTFTKNGVVSFCFCNHDYDKAFSWKWTGDNPTIFDLLYHISKYNETSSTPIELLWTKNLLSYLNIKG